MCDSLTWSVLNLADVTTVGFGCRTGAGRVLVRSITQVFGHRVVIHSGGFSHPSVYIKRSCESFLQL